MPKRSTKASSSKGKAKAKGKKPSQADHDGPQFQLYSADGRVSTGIAAGGKPLQVYSIEVNRIGRITSGWVISSNDQSFSLLLSASKALSSPDRLKDKSAIPINYKALRFTPIIDGTRFKGKDAREYPFEEEMDIFEGLNGGDFNASFKKPITSTDAPRLETSKASSLGLIALTVRRGRFTHPTNSSDDDSDEEKTTYTVSKDGNGNSRASGSGMKGMDIDLEDDEELEIEVKDRYGNGVGKNKGKGKAGIIGRAGNVGMVYNEKEKKGKLASHAVMTPANRIRGGAGPKTKTKAKRSRARSSSVSSWDSEAAANESSSSSIADSDDDNIPRGRDCDEDDDDVEDMIWEYHPSDEPKVVMSGNGRTPIVQKGWWRFEFRYSTLDVLKADGLLERVAAPKLKKGKEKEWKIEDGPIIISDSEEDEKKPVVKAKINTKVEKEEDKDDLDPKPVIKGKQKIKTKAEETPADDDDDEDDDEKDIKPEIAQLKVKAKADYSEGEIDGSSRKANKTRSVGNGRRKGKEDDEDEEEIKIENDKADEKPDIKTKKSPSQSASHDKITRKRKQMNRSSSEEEETTRNPRRFPKVKSAGQSTGGRSSTSNASGMAQGTSRAKIDSGPEEDEDMDGLE